jgi:hypothetical protein
MSNFSYLKKLEVKDKTTKYTIFQIQGEPSLILKPANESNKTYFNAILKRSRSNMRAIQAGHVNQVMIAEAREKDRDLFPQCIVMGWENVKDAEGKNVPFNREACTEFLQALPDWLFDEIRNFASNSANFADDIQINDPGNL